VSVLGLVFYVSGIDRNTSFSFFRSLIDVIEVNDLVGRGGESGCQNLGDGRGQSGLAVVNVTDGADVKMRFRSVKFFFCQFTFSFSRDLVYKIAILVTY